MGFGLPAAIGAKLAEPGRPVISLMGDGGIQFTLPELASAVEARVGVIVLLWNNQGYGEIKRYTPSENQETNGPRGRRVGIAYELESGEIIYVPE